MKDKTILGWIKPFLLFFCLLIIIKIGSQSVGSIPPIGKFFNPFSGFWRNAESFQDKNKNIRIPKVREPVTVVYDERAVPHIFAQNLHDLFLAQGFVTARDRLWQMETQTRATAGTLAEVFGSALIEHDRFQRRLGIPHAAEKDVDLMRKDDETWEAISAYTEGVNGYIASLSPSQLPLEYKLLNYSPKMWEPLNTALLVKQLQWTLSGEGNDLAMTNNLSKFGMEFVQKLFPTRVTDVLPVIPNGTTWNKENSPNAIPKNPLKIPNLLPFGPTVPASPTQSLPGNPTSQKPDPGNGSNNFVINGFKTQSGAAILANDPHLQLNLPSAWYEVQLSAPGISAYGVSLPCAPGIVIGYNHKIAWGTTSGKDDVFDWYRITFRDTTLTEYLFAGQWKRTTKITELIHVKNEPDILDTVVYTHQGPIVLKSQEKAQMNTTPALHAIRWLALEPSNEIKTFLNFMKSQNYSEFSKATTYFSCPSQNFAYASTENDIAMFHQGQFPRKWIGQGRFILNGSDRDNDWSGSISSVEVPSAKNPPQHWLASSNQNPTDSTYPYYLGSQFLTSDRTRRLGQILTDAESLGTAKAFGILLDDYDLNAAELLPTFFSYVTKSKLGHGDSLAITLLQNWNRRHDKDSAAPVLFEIWWSQLYHSIWHDEFSDDSLSYEWPSKNRTRELIMHEPTSPWFDDITTPAKENLAILIVKSFHEATILANQNRDLANPVWKTWSQFRPVNIRHLAHIDAFSRLGIASGGCTDCVNALKESHGPSWRMVVDLQKKPRGFGIYPGGQSGNPGSRHYDDFIQDWAAGSYYEFAFMNEPNSASQLGTAEKKGYRLQMKGK